MSTYKPGDIANGHILGSDGVWRPFQQPVPYMPLVKASNAPVTAAAWLVILLILSPVIAFAVFLILATFGVAGGSLVTVLSEVPAWAWQGLGALAVGGVIGHLIWRWSR